MSKFPEITAKDFLLLQTNIKSIEEKQQHRFGSRNFIQEQIFKDNTKIASRSNNLLNLASSPVRRTARYDSEEKLTAAEEE